MECLITRRWLVHFGLVMTVLAARSLALPVDKSDEEHDVLEAAGLDEFASNIGKLEKDMIDAVKQTHQQISGDLKKEGVKLQQLPKNYDNTTHMEETIKGHKVKTDTEIKKHDNGNVTSEVIKETKTVDGKPHTVVEEIRIRDNANGKSDDQTKTMSGDDGIAKMSLGNYTNEANLVPPTESQVDFEDQIDYPWESNQKQALWNTWRMRKRGAGERGSGQGRGRTDWDNYEDMDDDEDEFYDDYMSRARGPYDDEVPQVRPPYMGRPTESPNLSDFPFESLKNDEGYPGMRRKIPQKGHGQGQSGMDGPFGNKPNPYYDDKIEEDLDKYRVKWRKDMAAFTNSPVDEPAFDGIGEEDSDWIYTPLSTKKRNRRSIDNEELDAVSNDTIENATDSAENVTAQTTTEVVTESWIKRFMGPDWDLSWVKDMDNVGDIQQQLEDMEDTFEKEMGDIDFNNIGVVDNEINKMRADIDQSLSEMHNQFAQGELKRQKAMSGPGF